MAYSKTTWVDGSAPAISASNLNKIETGIYDSLRQDGTTSMSGQLLTISGSATTASVAASGDTNTGLFFPSANTTAITTDGSERLRITSTGNVGIGTISPTNYSGRSNLVLNGSDGGIIELMLGGDVKFQVYPESSTAPENIRLNARGSSGQYIFETNTNEKMRLTTSGYLLIGYSSSNGSYPLQVNGQIFATSATIATSDGRYKKDITPLTGALSLVNALNPVQFNWNDHPVHNFNKDNPTVGFIAQEVQEALKDKLYLNSVVKKSICEWEVETGEFIEKEIEEEIDGEIVKSTIQEPIKKTKTEEFYGIAESNLIAILTKAVQELSAEVTALKAKIK